MQTSRSLSRKGGNENAISSICYRVFVGIVFGFANIIPGVSGGTAMVVLGVYERIIAIITDFRHKIKTEWKFFLPILVGMGVAIFVFGSLMSDLLKKYNAVMQMFFMGVIIFSLPQLAKSACFNASHKLNVKPAHVVAFVLVLALMAFLAYEDGKREEAAAPAQTAAGNVENTSEADPEGSEGEAAAVQDGENAALIDGQTEENAALTDSKTAENAALIDGETTENVQNTADTEKKAAETEKKAAETDDYDPDHSVLHLLLLVVYGAIGSSTMIIPGISGSLVMVMLGQYDNIMHALKHFDVLTLLPFGIGCVLGIIFCAKLIRWLLKKHSQLTYSAILGFVLGSVLSVFPGWKTVFSLAGIIAFIIGGACILGCDLLSRKFNPQETRLD